VIHPRDSQEEAPFAELRCPVLRTSELSLKGVREHASLTSDRAGCLPDKGRPYVGKGAECCEEVTMATFVKVAKAADVEPGCRKSFEVNGKRIALFNVEGILITRWPVLKRPVLGGANIIQTIPSLARALDRRPRRPPRASLRSRCMRSTTHSPSRSAAKTPAVLA
jgi:hypothetical protein